MVHNVLPGLAREAGADFDLDREGAMSRFVRLVALATISMAVASYAHAAGGFSLYLIIVPGSGNAVAIQKIGDFPDKKSCVAAAHNSNFVGSAGATADRLYCAQSS